MRGVFERAISVWYHWWMDCEVQGAENIPESPGFIVAANHSSHLDFGIILHGLGRHGRSLCSLAARDYFFDTALKRFFIGKFTNFIPISRGAAVAESLKLAGDALDQGR